jgi:hypothetical protein
MTRSANVALPDILVRTTAHIKSITSRAISTSPVFDAGIVNGGLPKPIKPMVIRTDTQSLYCSMREDADKVLK